MNDKVLEDSKRPSLVHIGKMSFSVLASRRGWREGHLVHKALTISGVWTSSTQDIGDVPDSPPTYSHRTSSVELEDGLIQHLCMPCAASNLEGNKHTRYSSQSGCAGSISYLEEHARTTRA